MKKDLYICTTPFQMISAISMRLSFGNAAEIFVDPQSPNSVRYIENVRKQSIFDKVYNANEISILGTIRNPNKTKRKLLITLAYVFINRVIRKMFPDGFDYSTVYLSNNTFVANLIVQYVNLHRLNVDFVYYDDGEGSYDNNTVDLESKADRIIKRILHRSIVPAKKSRLLYSPELYRMIHPDTKEEIGRVPYFNATQEIQETIERIFETDSIQTIDEPVVILDAIAEECFSETDANRYLNLIQTICNSLKGDVCVKKHPRDKKSNKYGCKEYNNNSVPFEMLCLCSDFTEKTLIVLSSTSIMTPKIIFNQEPHIILLYRLFEMKNGFKEEREKLYEAMKGIYSDPDKISIPETEEQLIRTINSLEAAGDAKADT